MRKKEKDGLGPNTRERQVSSKSVMRLRKVQDKKLNRVTIDLTSSKYISSFRILGKNYHSVECK